MNRDAMAEAICIARQRGIAAPYSKPVQYAIMGLRSMGTGLRADDASERKRLLSAIEANHGPKLRPTPPHTSRIVRATVEALQDTPDRDVFLDALAYAMTGDVPFEYRAGRDALFVAVRNVFSMMV